MKKHALLILCALSGLSALNAQARRLDNFEIQSNRYDDVAVTQKESDAAWDRTTVPEGDGDNWVLYYDGSTTGKVTFSTDKYSMMYFQTDKGTFGIYPIQSSVNNITYASAHNSVSFHSDADCSAQFGFGYVSGCYDSSHGQSAQVTVKKIWLLKAAS